MNHVNVAIILIHGFCGDVTHVEPLARRLKQLGYSVYTPCLKGHTGSRKELKQATYNDWIDDVERVYLSLKDQYKEIVLIGFSMGGLIALHLASIYDVKSVITLNTPIYIWNVNNIMKYILSDFRRLQFKFIRQHVNVIKRYSVHAVKNFMLLLKQTKQNLKNINCDVLLNQAYDDETVRYKSVNYLYEHIGSEHKQMKLYKNSNHMILQSEIAEEVMNDVFKYLGTGN